MAIAGLIIKVITATRRKQCVLRAENGKAFMLMLSAKVQSSLCLNDNRQARRETTGKVTPRQCLVCHLYLECRIGLMPQKSGNRGRRGDRSDLNQQF